MGLQGRESRRRIELAEDARKGGLTSVLLAVLPAVLPHRVHAS